MPAESDGEAQGERESLSRAAAPRPESSRSPVFVAIAPLDAEGEPVEGPPLESATDTPQRRKLLLPRVGRQAECDAEQTIGPERVGAPEEVRFPSATVERLSPSQP